MSANFEADWERCYDGGYGGMIRHRGQRYARAVHVWPTGSRKWMAATIGNTHMAGPFPTVTEAKAAAAELVRP